MSVLGIQGLFAAGAIAAIWGIPGNYAVGWAIDYGFKYGPGKLGQWIGREAYDGLVSVLDSIRHDPLILDLDGDGIELSALGVAGEAGASDVHFDYNGDGFAERTGWVSADDGILVIDKNENGLIETSLELFGSTTQDGFDVLELLDSNGDGVIDASDAKFFQLKVWRDLDQDGVSDAGELQSLTDAGVSSISLTRTDVFGENEGHARGFQAAFNRVGGGAGVAETIYFDVDRQATQDNTPSFTPATDVEKLPQLPGSGLIHSIAWKASQDSTFFDDWRTASAASSTF